MPPGMRHLLGERGVHVVVRVDQAEAVGPEQAARRRSAHRTPISFSSSAPSAPTSLKPAVMTTMALAPAWIEASTALRTSGRGDGDHGQVDAAAVGWRGRIARQAQDLVGRRVDRDDRALEPAADQVGDQFVPDLARRAGRADHGDGLGTSAGIPTSDNSFQPVADAAVLHADETRSPAMGGRKSHPIAVPMACTEINPNKPWLCQCPVTSWPHFHERSFLRLLSFSMPVTSVPHSCDVGSS